MAYSLLGSDQWVEGPHLTHSSCCYTLDFPVDCHYTSVLLRVCVLHLTEERSFYFIHSYIWHRNSSQMDEYIMWSDPSKMWLWREAFCVTKQGLIPQSRNTMAPVFEKRKYLWGWLARRQEAELRSVSPIGFGYSSEPFWRNWNFM